MHADHSYLTFADREPLRGLFDLPNSLTGVAFYDECMCCTREHQFGSHKAADEFMTWQLLKANEPEACPYSDFRFLALSFPWTLSTRRPPFSIPRHCGTSPGLSKMTTAEKTPTHIRRLISLELTFINSKFKA